jgi:thiol-disulfide isomerase/thioredoxin
MKIKRKVFGGIWCFSALVALIRVTPLQAQKKPNELWEGKLKLNDSIQLSFNFEIATAATTTQIIIHNADERIVVDEVSDTKDSLNFKMPLFDSEFKCKKANGSLSGLWINHSRKTNNIFTFFAFKTISLYPVMNHPPFNGKWEVTFSPNSADEYKGIGLFEHANKNRMAVTGTILTETGDYRYLAGVAQNDTTLYLSCFDGTHAFVFKAKLKANGVLDGDFYSGSHWHEKWMAKRNDKFELHNPDSLTYLKPGFNKLEFSFPDLEGKKVSLTDPKYKNKVVIVQIMGSWCPNCIDETKFLSGFYDKYKAEGLEIIALAYERSGEMTKAVANVQRLKKKFNCNYDVLIAALNSDKKETAKSLPMMDNFMSFPTTIYIDKKGKVRKIYTGFNGPATGKYYEKYVDEINAFVGKLLKE